MQASIDMYKGVIPKEDIEQEIEAFVKAINELELYYYEEKSTKLEEVLAYYE